HPVLHPLYLPSFPTRRSSDLHPHRVPPAHVRGGVVGTRRASDLPDLRPLHEFVVLPPQVDLPEVAEVPAVADDAVLGGQRPGEEDRKSTRLNSSHVKISYAVF